MNGTTCLTIDCIKPALEPITGPSASINTSVKTVVINWITWSRVGMNLLFIIALIIVVNWFSLIWMFCSYLMTSCAVGWVAGVTGTIDACCMGVSPSVVAGAGCTGTSGSIGGIGATTASSVGVVTCRFLLANNCWSVDHYHHCTKNQNYLKKFLTNTNHISHNLL